MKANHPTLIGIIAPLLWSTTLPCIKKCSPDIGALYLPAIQCLTSGSLGFLYFGVTGQGCLDSLKCPRFVPRLCIFMLYFLMLYPAVHIVQKPNFPGVLLLNYLWPTFTLLFTLALTRQAVKPFRLLVGSCFVVVGLGIEILPNTIVAGSVSAQVDPIPYMLAFGSAVAWGLYSAFNKQWGDAAGGAQAIPLLMLITGIALLILAALSESGPRFSSDTVLPLTYLCSAPFFANVAWDIGTRRGNLPLLSLVCDFIPWIALTLTALYLEIQLGEATIISAVLIVCGAVISRLSLLPARSGRGANRD